MNMFTKGVTMMCGGVKSGKTNYLVSEALNLTKSGFKVLYISRENRFDSILENFIPQVSKRMFVDGTRYVYIPVENAFEQTKSHNYYELSEVIEKEMKDENIDYIFIDGFSILDRTFLGKIYQKYEVPIICSEYLPKEFV